MTDDLVITIAETRIDEAPTIRRLLRSLGAHCPGARVRLFHPATLGGFDASALPLRFTHEHLEIQAGSGWNIKPAILSHVLRNADQALWIDSDILVARDFLPFICKVPSATLAVAQEPRLVDRQGGNWRARAWKLSPGRSLTWSINSCLLLVSRAHLPLLDAWRESLQHPEYLAWQMLPSNRRPLHMFSDQDVLEALLTSANYSDLPLVFFRPGYEVVQGGAALFSLSERLAAWVCKRPFFYHAIGYKPWWPRTPSHIRNISRYFDELSLDLSPYTLLLRSHPEWSSEDEPPPWLAPHYRVARVMRACAGYHPALSGFIPAVVDTLKMLAHRMVPRRSKSPSFEGSH